jgi:hypothetical protein
MSAEALDDLARARAAFASWRSGRRRPGRIPERLWAPSGNGRDAAYKSCVGVGR